MEINYWLILLATVAQFVLGAIWYSPLMFAKWWMEITECTDLSKKELEKMQSKMMPFYGLQFFLTLFSTFSLANFVHFVINTDVFSIYHIAFWIWIGFMAPLVISSVIWGNTKQQLWIKQIFVMLSMQLVGIMLASFILSI